LPIRRKEKQNIFRHWLCLKTKGIPMKSSLEVRRVQLLRELAHVDREIVRTQKSLLVIHKRLAVLKQVRLKAA
jgi:thermostable 8-oxoguanine DNA glycosylase